MKLIMCECVEEVRVIMKSVKVADESSMPIDYSARWNEDIRINLTCTLQSHLELPRVEVTIVVQVELIVKKMPQLCS
jgi:hypothetical protein